MSELTLLIASQFVFTLVQACLLVVILRKAGYGAGVAALGLAPIFAHLVNTFLLATFVNSIVVTVLISVLIGLVPLVLLAFGTWPRDRAMLSTSETFQ